MSPEHDNVDAVTGATVDAVTGATKWKSEAEAGEGSGEMSSREVEMGAEPCGEAELGAQPCGEAKPAGEPGGEEASGEDAPVRTRSIQEVVDAVTGATWSTRNRIMEDLFREDLNVGASNLPTFAPPGTPVR